MAAGEGGDRPNRDEWRKRLESMTPEQRDQMRERMRARFGESGPGGRGMAGGPRASQDGPATRTVYVIEKKASGEEKPKENSSVVAGLLPNLSSNSTDRPMLKPVTIKTGISDGTYTEVLEGLNEGDVIVTGVNLPAGAAAATTANARPPNSPFGGPFGGGFRR